jgi:hypothetical protein
MKASVILNLIAILISVASVAFSAGMRAGRR